MKGGGADGVWRGEVVKDHNVQAGEILKEWDLDNPLKMDNQVMTRKSSAPSDYK